MMPQGWRVGLLLLVVVLTFELWTQPARGAARPQVIVQPDDVATPTATFTMILFPTATPTPIPAATIAPPQAETNSDSVHDVAEFASYVVKPGDTLLSVALEMGVDVGDMPCAIAPDFRRTQPLVIGDTLEVPPVGWRCHEVGADETLAQIAAHYDLDPSRILGVAWNALDVTEAGKSVLEAGRFIRIPPAFESGENGGFLNYMLDQPLSVSPMTAYAIGGTKPRPQPMVGPLPKDWPYGSGNFMWPVYGWLSQGYRLDHRAIDIAAPAGTFVTASDRGVVIRAGWNDQGYGNFVVIDHNIDYITLYAHMTEIVVKEGDVVAQGQIIGTVGSTGNSTGPHLHFEIRDFGRRANPLDLLVR